jgi:hypothetical protein
VWLFHLVVWSGDSFVSLYLLCLRLYLTCHLLSAGCSCRLYLCRRRAELSHLPSPVGFIYLGFSWVHIPSLFSSVKSCQGALSLELCLQPLCVRFTYLHNCIAYAIQNLFHSVNKFSRFSHLGNLDLVHFILYAIPLIVLCATIP